MTIFQTIIAEFNRIFNGVKSFEIDSTETELQASLTEIKSVKEMVNELVEEKVSSLNAEMETLKATVAGFETMKSEIETLKANEKALSETIVNLKGEKVELVEKVNGYEAAKNFQSKISQAPTNGSQF